jgi:hypothetical protein
MADDFLELQDQLAVMVGAASVLDLPDVEQRQVKSIINQAYRTCYSPVNGYRPEWAKLVIGLDLPAAISIDVVMEKGSKNFSFTYTGPSGDLLVSDYVGSIMRFGSETSRLASVPTASTGTMVTPASADRTGSCTVHVHSHVLPDNVVDVDPYPELIGHGPLAPMSDKQEIKFRSNFGYDFSPEAVYGGGNVPKFIFHGGSEYQFGNPLFYHIEDTQFETDVLLAPRFVVYPLPDKATQIRLTANIMPVSLEDDDDVPRLPTSAMHDILLPIARSKYAEISPRYNSENIKFLVEDRREAERRLNTMANRQKQQGRRITLRAGY